MTTPAAKPDTLTFVSDDAWADWLKAHHAESPGIWMRILKKGSGMPTVTYDQAVEIALCYGWIDGQKGPGTDEHSWLQRFAPRKARSGWSKRNTEKAERLIAEGRMTERGLAEIEAARRDGRWDSAYHPQSTMEVPPDFQAALDVNPAAKAFFDGLGGSRRYSFLYPIVTAKKPETRAARIEKFIGMLERGELRSIFKTS